MGQAMLPPASLLLLIGVPVAALGCVALGWWLRGRFEAVRRGPPRRRALVPQGPSLSRSEAPSSPTDPGPRNAVRPPTSARPAHPRPGPLGPQNAARVIQHLARLGRVGPDDVAPLGSTQQGMGQALGLSQGTLAKVLHRLVAAGALSVDRRHVSGSNRRLKVYRLSAYGEGIARDLLRRRP